MKKVWIAAAAGLLIALVLGGILSPFASPRPDGLERVADDKWFAEKGEGEPAFEQSPMPDYTIPSVRDERTSTRLAGLIGTLLAFGLGAGAALVLRTAGKRNPARPNGMTPGQRQA